MSSLSLREQLLLGSIMAAVLVGMTVKHWRDARRENMAAVTSSGHAVAPRAAAPIAPATP